MGNNALLHNWRKDNSRRSRRQVVLKDCHGNKRTAGQALLNYSRGSGDPEIKQKARADAMYFFNLCRGNGHKPNLRKDDNIFHLT